MCLIHCPLKEQIGCDNVKPQNRKHRIDKRYRAHTKASQGRELTRSMHLKITLTEGGDKFVECCLLNHTNELDPRRLFVRRLIDVALCHIN